MIHRRLKQTLRWGFPLLAFIAVGLASAASNPGYLGENISNVPAGTKTYRIWYSTDCNTGANCDCDSAADVDTNSDGTADQDSPNGCIATTDSGANGVFDTGPDDDGDSVLDVVDVDWTDGGDGSGLVESVPYNIQQTLDRYLNDWGLKEPKWTANTNRDVFVYDLDAYGYAYPDGTGIELDTAWMLTQAPEPRGSVLHELWHTTQYAYDASSGNWLMEGQARMLQDKVFDDLDNKVTSRYHNSVNSYLGNTTYVVKEDRDDDGTDEFSQAVGLLGASYNASLWWTYLADQAGIQYVGTAGDGIDLLEAVLEESDDNGRQGVDAVDRVLRDRLGQGFDDTFWDFTIANYAKDFDLTRLDHDDLGGRDPEEVLKYSDEKPTAPNMLIYGPVERETFSVADLSAGVNGSVDAMSSDVSDADAMSAYGANYYQGTLENSDNCMLAYWRVIGEDSARFMHSWMLIEEDTNGDGVEEVVSLLRSEGKDFARAVWNYGRRASGVQYTKMVGIVATADDPYGYDWEMGCTQPSVDIVAPKTANPAYVGDPNDPRRFLVWVKVTGNAGTSTYVDGLDWTRDFTVTVGADTATILNGGYVQNQYWLAVQAPQKPAASIGDKFNLTVSLGPSGVGISDTETNAVIYDLVVSDQVLVIDRSGSMADFSKLDSAKTAARLFTDVKQKFDKLGVVSFSNDATQEYALTTVPDQDDAAGVRAAAQATIDAISDENMTSIGDGLQKGQDMLNASGNPAHQWVMVLLSDGMENEPQYWSNVKANITSAGTRVHAIALGQDADEELMREIAETTCGDVWQDQCYHYIEESGVLAAAQVATPAGVAAATNLPNALADVYRRAEETIAQHQRLWEAGGTLNGNQTIYVDINEDGVRNAFFSFNWNDSAAPLGVSITGPAGTSFTNLTDGKNHTVLYADKLPPGTYRVDLSASSGASEWIGSLSGKLIHGTELYAFLDNTLTQRYPGLPVRLQAILTDDAGAVREASVIASVRRPDGSTEQVQLVDDGGPYDAIANDGVYSYVYDRINRPLAVNVLLGHSWIFDIQASGLNNSGRAFERYKRLTYTPYLGREQTSLDSDGDGMLDRWEDRFDNVTTGVFDPDKDLDNDGLLNRDEFERGTNPDDPDTDKGGETDGSEVAKGQNPLLTADDTIPPVTDFWIEDQPERVTLHFNPRPEYQKMRVYRRTGAAGPFNLVGEFDPSTGQITDGPLVNDQDYFYFIQPVGASSATGRPSRALYGEPAADPYQPEGVVVINNDDKYTASKNVTLSFQGLTLTDGSLDVRHVQISNSPDLTGVPWQPFAQKLPWVLDPDPQSGAAFVYVRFRDGAGNVSDVIYGDGILYKPPVILPAGLLDFGWVIADFSNSAFTGLNIIYTPLSKPSRPLGAAMSPLSASAETSELRSAGISFELEARDGSGRPVTQFTTPFTVEVHYEDWMWRSSGIGYEETLTLYWNNGGAWEPVPCNGCSHDTTNNIIIVTLDHLTEFALAGMAEVREDVDDDGDVDVADLVTVAGLWRRTLTDAGYSRTYDVHSDGVINLIDLQRIAARWNWRLGR